MGKKSRRRKGSQDSQQPIEVTLSRAQEVREVSLRDTNEVRQGDAILDPAFGIGISAEYRF